MKCSKIIVIGAVLTSGMLAFGDAVADLKAAKDAYALIKSDKAAAAQVQKMFEALPETSQTDSYAGYCLRIQGKYAEAISSYNKALKLATAPNDILNLNSDIAMEYYALGQPENGIKAIKAALEAGQSAHVKCRIYATSRYAQGLILAKRYAEATPVIVDYIVTCVRQSGAADAEVVKWFEKIHPESISADVYKTALTDIIKAVPATEANAEFLGRVKSELEKMK